MNQLCLHMTCLDLNIKKMKRGVVEEKGYFNFPLPKYKKKSIDYLEFQWCLPQEL